MLADKGSEGITGVTHSVENAVDCPAVRSEAGIVQFMPEDRD